MRAKLIKESLNESEEFKKIFRKESPKYEYHYRTTLNSNVLDFYYNPWNKTLSVYSYNPKKNEYTPEKVINRKVESIERAMELVSEYKSNSIKENIIDSPDWHSGSDFGIPRTPDIDSVKKYVGISKTVQDKIDSLENKANKIYAKWKQNPDIMFTVKKGVMRKLEKVSPKEALSLIDKSIDTWRRTRSSGGGIIIYV